MAVPYPEIRCITFVRYQFRSVYSQRHQQCAECITVPLSNVLNSVRGACRYFDNVSIIWCRRAFARNACRMRRHATANGHNNFINNSISSASERATSVHGSTVFGRGASASLWAFGRAKMSAIRVRACRAPNGSGFGGTFTSPNVRRVYKWVNGCGWRAC